MENKNITHEEILEKAKIWLASKSNKEWIKAFKKLEKEQEEYIDDDQV